MKIPTNLKHKPCICVEDYAKVDGKQAYASDTQGLSLGLAQWNDRGRVDASCKVWRYSGERWSRQSEELPLHRVLDLAILLVRSRRFLCDEAYRKGIDLGKPQIDRIGLQGDAMTLSICVDNEQITDDLDLLIDAFGRDDELLSERMHVLKRELEEAGF
ncbi:MAG: DUF6530 family protein [Clostridiales bacterium]|nr:DUF6530 family protein [Clostridiales bacterium]